MGEIENRPQHDPAQLRISDADRHRVTELLREAAGEGRLDLDELEERLELTWAAKTYAELVPITLDLQAPGVGAPHVGAPARRTPPPVPAVGHNSSTAIMGDCKRQGVWSIPERHTAFALMGSVLIDLRQAQLSAHETTITANAVMGEVKVIVPAHLHVVVDGTPIMGDYSLAKDKTPAELGPDSPVVRLRGVALMGSVTVERQPAPGTPKKYLGTY
ncbi:DUF1707 domain-containing protein [Nocardioides sp.]|uniref:DUF1707 SHOCT-like domain-containing protein n=1 Tax=Nocardioides sp. TaxID=35761 RepID=UPI001A2C7FDA|nr:DUF1707 domain-containing protein [Nocardioides sp.]MBJ7356981.1 DUF1707 and DUF2154 domain-containing protein [Nocardioides sp.]